MQFLNAIFNVTALAVNMLVNPLWTLFHVGNDETRIVSGLFVGCTDNFGFDDDAAQAWPLPNLVANFHINIFGLHAAPRARQPSRRHRKTENIYGEVRYKAGKWPRLRGES